MKGLIQAYKETGKGIQRRMEHVQYEFILFLATC